MFIIYNYKKVSMVERKEWLEEEISRIREKIRVEGKSTSDDIVNSWKKELKMLEHELDNFEDEKVD